jgi:biopolymer transport protein ExbB/TolQ
MMYFGWEQRYLAGGLDYALRQASWPGLLVIVVLLFVSSFSWAVMITKYRSLQRASKASRDFLNALRADPMPLALFARGQRFEDSPHYKMYHAGSVALTTQLLGDATVDSTLEARLNEAPRVSSTQLEMVQLALHQACGESALQLESQTSLLATAVSGGPFLGLLGTVWGVMDTFSAIAASTSAASVKDMAPGVSAALVTTVIGLLVAIPAMFGYNYLVSRVRSLVLSLENFAAEILVAWQQRWLAHGGIYPPISISTPTVANVAKNSPFRASMIASLPTTEPARQDSISPEPALEAVSTRLLAVDPESGLSED